MMAREDKGTKRTKVDELRVPPGFVSLTSFTLKRVEINDEAYSSMAFGSDFEPGPAQVDRNSSKMDTAKLEKSLRSRPWILHNQLHNPEDPDSEHPDKILPVNGSLPRGVTHGCSSINECPKVTSSWCPEVPCMAVTDQAPVFHPTQKEFEDTLEYVASIRPQAEKYGICVIVPPPSWQPPCLIKENNVWGTSRFCSHIQKIEELQTLHSKRKLSRINDKKRRKRTSRTGLEYGNGGGFTTDHDETEVYTDGFDFVRGPEFTLETFKKYADDFKDKYLRKKHDVSASSVYSSMLQDEWFESEYWRIVENPTEETEVFVADLDSKDFGSGFPVLSEPLKTTHNFVKHLESGWNLNNTPKLPGSLLAFESCDVSAISSPQVNVGMCFSSLCWKIEEHHLYSLRYTHLGAAKIWYGIPGRYFLKFEAAVKKTFPELSEYPELSYKLVTQLSLSTLKSEGIPVFRCVQYPRQFVLIFPGAYYSGFDCGFNCSEAVNFAPPDWLSYGQNALDFYCKLPRKTLFSHDKLLIGAAMEAVRGLRLQTLARKDLEFMPWKSACGKDGILTKALKSRVKQECMRRDYLSNPSQSRKMEKDFDSTFKRECSICFYDLHLSAVSCPCSPDKYCCIIHSKELCSCPWSSRLFLFRHEISELELLVEALEGKLSSALKYAREYLGLSLRSLSPTVVN